MKTKYILAALLLLSSLGSVYAQLTIPSDGSDGAFSPATNVEVDLSQAITGTWSNSNSANAGKGTYDSDKWAIVFKYSSVTIPAGVTVTFKNHRSYAPVVWLVQGSVNIAGVVKLDGGPAVNGPSATTPTEPGPGGFRGGPNGPSGGGFGLGPGGGFGQYQGGSYSSSYGNPQILPLIGGSGAAYFNDYAGGGGGGAILIAAPGVIQVAGSISSLGGGGGGSGGAIKLIANQVTGNGSLNAATTGRTRVEANSLASTISITPSTIAVAPGTAPTIFQSASSPTVRIASVDGLNAPGDPSANLISSSDIAIQKNTPVVIVLETRNFATAGAVVAVRIANKYGNSGNVINATLDSGGTTTLSTWRLSTTLAPGFVTLQARATGP